MSIRVQKYHASWKNRIVFNLFFVLFMLNFSIDFKDIKVSPVDPLNALGFHLVKESFIAKLYVLKKSNLVGLL